MDIGGVEVGAWWLIAAGIFLGVVYVLMTRANFPRGANIFVAIVAAAVFIVGAVDLAGVGDLGTTETQTAGGATYSVNAAVGDAQNSSNVVIDNQAHTIQVQVQCGSSCASFSYSSGTTEINFTISRDDTGTQDVSTSLVHKTTALVSAASGSGTTYPIIALNTDGTYNAEWEKGPDSNPATANKQTTLLLEGGGSNFARFNITWNIQAVAEQTVFNSAVVTVEVAGVTWTITEILTEKS